jgi:hypothetical protein
VRNKKASEEMIRIAEDNGMVLLQCPFSMFRSSGILFAAGIRPVY